MDIELLKRLTPLLLNEFKFKQSKKHLISGICPDCNKDSLWTHADSPWLLKCNHINNCGYSGLVKDIFPEVFCCLSDTVVTTDVHPNAVADAYLNRVRKLNKGRLLGSYSQETFQDYKTKRTTATIRFYFGLSKSEWWERFIDNAHLFESPSRFKPGGSYAGLWYQPPTFDQKSKEIWITEGIFNALALCEHGKNAVATMSSNNMPTIMLTDIVKRVETEQAKHKNIKVPLPTIIIAFDNDKAGIEGAKKLLDCCKSLGFRTKAVLPYYKNDWNDLHQKNQLEESDFEKFAYYGALEFALTKEIKANLIYERTKSNIFTFDFDHKIYEFKYKEAKNDDDDKDPFSIKEIINCVPKPIYYIKNQITDDAWYYFDIDYCGKHHTIPFTSTQVNAGAEFAKRLTHSVNGALAKITNDQLYYFLKNKLKVITVNAIDFVGYSKEHKCYVYNDLAIKDGKCYPKNKYEYISMNRFAIKTLTQSPHLEINQKKDGYLSSWPQMIKDAWGTKGLIVAAWWFGSMFAEQIRKNSKSYPFMEFVGEPNSGKSTLIQFLWKLYGRDHEGSDPTKGSAISLLRTFAQVGNLPVVLIEGDRDKESHAKKYDFDGLKTLYGGGTLRSIGARTATNETIEPAFRGAVMISQNNNVIASPPVLQRICYVNFDKPGSAKTLAASEKIEKIEISQVSNFLIRAAMSEASSLKIINNYKVFECVINERVKIRDGRILKTHSQLMACAQAFCSLVGLSDADLKDMHDQIVAMAEAKQASISADLPIIQTFWENVQWLINMGAPINHRPAAANEIAINLNDYIMLSKQHGQTVPEIQDLKAVLKFSKTNKYKDQKVIRSQAILSNGLPLLKNKHCWIFEKGLISTDDDNDNED